jgi:hypothetical protein
VYKPAIIVTNPGKLPNRAKAAKAAIDTRLCRWTREVKAIVDALAGLSILRRELEKRFPAIG